jgi:hypothetical protein
MARQNATNFTGGLQFPYATAATDLFKKEDVQTLALAVDQHDHTAGKGLSVAPAAGSITNAMLGPDVARDSWLVNGGFDIWQRGTSFTLGAGAAYGPDRWGVNGIGSATINLVKDTSNADSASGACCAATYTHVAGSQLNIQQTLTAAENPQLKGRVVSFSMRVRTAIAGMVRLGVYDGTVWNYSPYHNGNGAYQTLTVSNITLGAAAAAWYVGLWWDSAISGLAYLDNAMLVIGSQAANYVPLHPADDLARCLRYYQRWAPASASSIIATNYAYATTNANAPVPVQARFAVTPSATISAASDWGMSSGAGAVTACSSLTVGPHGGGAVLLAQGTTASGLVIGQAGVFATMNANAWFAAEANP